MARTERTARMHRSGFTSGGIYHEIDGAGDPVLLIPGWGGSIRDLDEIREALIPKYRVIAADPPGSGRSNPQPRTYTISYLEDDAHAFLAMLEELHVPRVHVIGYSDGGEYALLMARNTPDSIRSIVAWGAAGQFLPSTGLLDAWAELVDHPIPALREFSDYLRGAYGEANARIMIRSHAQSLRAIADAGGDVSRSKASTITCPALLIVGQNDFMAPPALVADMAGAVKHARFVEVAGAPHAVHRERPGWLVDEIVSWLAEN
jgi:pimeloyl-ACP methyl ester carboxylesterase